VKTLFASILCNASRTLSVGFTNDLERRVREHRATQADSFTRKYTITLLRRAEEFSQVGDVIAREKELKGWSRAKKIAVIEESNPNSDELSAGW